MRKIIGVIAALLVVAAAQIAQAADTQLPPFDANRTVYVSPSLKQKGGDWDPQVNGLEQKLRQAASAQKLAVYCVFTLQGDESTGSKTFGEAKVNDLQQRWRGQPGFPNDNHLLIVMVRSKTNKDQWAVGVQVGDKAKKFISDSHIGDAIKDEKHYYTGGNHDYAGFTVAVTDNVCRRIGAAAAGHANTPDTNPNPPVSNPTTPPAAQPSSGGGGAVLFILGGLVILVVGGAAVYFFIVAPANELKALQAELVNPDSSVQPSNPNAGLRQKWDAAVNNVNGVIGAIQREYASLATGTWKFAPNSESDTSYQNALKLWARLYAHREAAKARNAEITAVENGSGSALSKARRIVALLRTEQIKITGEALQTTEISLLGGLVQNESYNAVDLIGVMEKEIKVVVGSFDGIEKSIVTARANADAIRAQVKVIDTKKGELEKAGLTFSPYQEQYAKIEGNIAKFVARISGDPANGVYGDPLGAKADSESEKSAVDALLARMTKALALKNEVPTVEKKIADVTARVQTQRSTAVSYKYSAPGAPETYTLTEEGANPDSKVANANEQVKAMSAAVLEGRVDDATNNRDAAYAACKEAGTIIDNVLAAKTKVETEAPEVETKLGTGAVVNTFKTMLTSTYGAGNFLLALTGLAAFQGLVRVREKKSSVTANRQSQDHITSADTDNKVKAAVSAVEALEQQFARATTNWQGQAATVESLVKQLEVAEQAVAADVTAHGNAYSSVQSFATAYSSAGATINDRRVSDAHRTNYQQLNGTLSTLQRDMGGRKANWTTIDKRADEGTAAVNVLTQKAQEEIRADEQAEAALNEAQANLLSAARRSYVRTINRVPYGLGVSLNSYEALRHQRNAEEYYRRRQYTLMDQELTYMRQAQYQADMFAWYTVWTMMAMANDMSARQYAYHQGYRDGMAWDAYHQHQVNSGWNPSSSSGWEPTPDTSWSWNPPRTDGNTNDGRTGSGGTGFEGGSNGSDWSPTSRVDSDDWGASSDNYSGGFSGGDTTSTPSDTGSNGTGFEG